MIHNGPTARPGSSAGAARLCSEAGPGQVLVSRRVLSAVEDLVEAEPLGDLALKGFLRPVAAFNVVRLRAGRDSPP
jgi:class 3 adenylate cyclase